MRFRQIRVRNFRKLLSPLVISGIGDGLTVIAGDNEEGKSTLLDAIRVGLFERHNLGGDGLSRMLPFGSRVRPEIELDFEINGRAYCLEKGFGQRPSARLKTPNGIFEGLAAEDELAKLLTFRVAQRGESKPDDRGVLGLFWLEQGRSLDGLDFGETGRSTLRSSFEKEVGDVLGGARSRRLMAAAKAKRDAFLTATGKPKGGGELAKAIAEAAAMTEDVARLESECADYERDIGELQRVQAKLARIKAERRLEVAREALHTAQSEAEKIEHLRQRDGTADSRLALANAELRLAHDRCEHRRELIETLRQRDQELAAAQNILALVEARTPEFARGVDAAKEARDNAVVTNSTADARLALAEAHARCEVLNTEIAELERRISEVEVLAATRATATAELASISIDEPAFEFLQRQESALREARAAIAAASTRLRFFPSDRQAVTERDRQLPVGEAVDVTEPTRFTLEGFGAAEVEPGGSVLAESRERVKGAEAAVSEVLSAVGLGDIAQARAQLAARRRAEDDITGIDRLIAVHAPQGVEALRCARREKLSERLHFEEEFDFAAAAAFSDPETERRNLNTAKQAETAARSVLDEARNRQHEHLEGLAIASAGFENAEGKSAQAKQELEAARAEISDSDLADKLSTFQQASADAQCAKNAAVQELAAANAYEVEERQQQARAALEATEAEQRNWLDKQIALENRLIGADKMRIREQLEEARGQENRAISRRNRVQAEADAWSLLLETLDGAERDAKRAFLEPVLQRVRPFLDLLFPGMGVKLDEETLEITEIAREGRTEPYRALSIGTREQLSILVRLAFAVYLREKGYPAAVILDDALVYADPDRFERMQLALRKAAETVQILILTCRPKDWYEVAMPIRRLAGAATAALEPA
jgi:uncharacterized protein YhaN